MAAIRLGLIGSGGFAAYRSHLFVGAGARFAGIAEPSPNARQVFTERVFPAGDAPPFYDDHAALLAAGDLDGVVVASPHGLHFQHVSDCLAAGLGVLVYKPMVTTSDDARELVRRADAAGRVVSIAVEGVYTPEFRYIRAAREAGELGDVTLVHGLVAQGWLELVGGTWRTDPVLGGGGNLIDSGYHLLAALLHLTGQEPEEAFAYIDRRDQRVDVHTAAVLRFDGGALGTVAVSGDAQGMEETLYLTGTRRSLSTGVYGGRLGFLTGWRAYDEPALEPAETAEENFVRCLRGEAETLTPPRLGLQLAHVVEAVVRSAAEHAPVPVARG